MSRGVAIGGFVAIQLVVAAVYAGSLLPLAGDNAPPFISDAMQVWSGGARADIVDSFRTGPTESAAPFKPFGALIWSVAGLLASAGAIWFGRQAFQRTQTWLAAGMMAAGLALGAGSAWLIITHWGGSVLYPAGSLNTAWLYMITRAFLVQLLIGYVLLAISTLMVVLEVARPQRPLGLHIVALNWAVVVATWSLAYLVLYVAPVLSRGA